MPREILRHRRRGARCQGGQFLRGLATKADAVGDADAVVGIADEAQAGKNGNARGDARDALLVADGVLRHGAAPARDLRVFGLDLDADGFVAEDFAQFAAHDGDESFIGAR